MIRECKDADTLSGLANWWLANAITFGANKTNGLSAADPTDSTDKSSCLLCQSEVDTPSLGMRSQFGDSDPKGQNSGQSRVVAGLHWV